MKSPESRERPVRLAVNAETIWRNDIVEASEGWKDANQKNDDQGNATRSRRKRSCARKDRKKQEWQRIERDRWIARRKPAQLSDSRGTPAGETLSATPLLIVAYQFQPEQSFRAMLFLRLPNLA